jgi:serine phosphatase RsbU (regulator of sigma subunit)
MEPQEIQFTIYQPSLEPSRVTVPCEQTLITLGRAVECTIPIKDRFLSRKHAEISFAAGQWFVRDCGSVNGTLINGVKVNGTAPLRPGDRIMLGDSEVVFEADLTDTAEGVAAADSGSQFIALDSTSHAKNLVVPLSDAIDDMARGRERTGILASLAVQFIEDRPMAELFDFILDRVAELLKPSRSAIALLGPDGLTFTNVHVRRDDGETSNLTISRTLLGEVIEGRSVVSFIDTSQDEKLSRAESIIGQHIRSALCAPLLVGDSVLGVLYLDFLANRGAVTHEDVQLIAQIARFAAVKLETTRLREESIAKAKIEEELRTAYKIQSRLLPAVLPEIEGYVFAGTNKPCKTVSGDYYDILVRPNGKIYFVIADVSGKGITAALIMSSLATAFSIFTRNDPSPAELVRELNITLAPKTAPTKFATLFAGLLDPATGEVEFANAGHVAPLVIGKNGVEQLTTTDMVIGLFIAAQYRNQKVTLGAGDSLVLFTDGVTEAENESEEQLGLDPVATMLAPMHGNLAPDLLDSIDGFVQTFIGTVPNGDDVTMLAVTRVG